ncbi:MAG: hypothetical protein GY926_27435, partial [bacterium]|nr:hypothetical protein [bacterium]
MSDRSCADKRGTPEGYQEHRAAGEPGCSACLEAMRTYNQMHPPKLSSQAATSPLGQRILDHLTNVDTATPQMINSSVSRSRNRGRVKRELRALELAGLVWRDNDLYSLPNRLSDNEP